jgi:hypothetical protein
LPGALNAVNGRLHPRGRGKPRTSPTENGSTIIHNNGFDKHSGLCVSGLLQRKILARAVARVTGEKSRHLNALQHSRYGNAAKANTQFLLFVRASNYLQPSKYFFSQE